MEGRDRDRQGYDNPVNFRKINVVCVLRETSSLFLLLSFTLSLSLSLFLFLSLSLSLSLSLLLILLPFHLLPLFMLGTRNQVGAATFLHIKPQLMIMEIVSSAKP